MNICLSPFMISLLTAGGNILCTTAALGRSYWWHPRGAGLSHPVRQRLPAAGCTFWAWGRAGIVLRHWRGAARRGAAPINYACCGKSMILRFRKSTHERGGLRLALADEVLGPAVPELCAHVFLEWFDQLRHEGKNGHCVGFLTCLVSGWVWVDGELFLQDG